MSKRAPAWILTATLGAAAPCALYAQQQSVASYGERSVVLRVGGGYSDNILREPDDGESSAYTAVGVELGINRSNRRVDASVVGDIEHRSYTLEGVENEVFGNLDASLLIHILVDRLAWLFSDSYGQIRQDPFHIDSPANREYLNLFSTGPRLRLPLGGRNVLELSALGTDRSYEKSAIFDGTATTVQAGYRRAVSARSSFGVSVMERTSEYDHLVLRDSELRNVFLGYESRLSSGSAAVAAGVSKVEVADRSSSAPYFDLTWSRNVGMRSRLVFGAGTEYVDAVEDFLDSAPIEGIPADRLYDVLPSADVIRQSEASISYSTEYGRMTFRSGVSVARQRYEVDAALTNTGEALQIGLTRRLTPRSDAGFDFYFVRRDFDVSGQEDTDRTGRLFWNRQFSNRFAMALVYQRDGRTSTLAAGFKENSIRVLFQMDAVSPSAPRPPRPLGLPTPPTSRTR